MALINEPNLTWIKLTPTTTIQTHHQIVIEVPTKGTDGRTLFANDLGTGVSDGGDLTTDVIDGDFTNTFMKCRLFHGDQGNSKAARIVCGDFSQSIENNELLWFAFKVTNPSVSPQISIPFFIYSMDLDTMFKSNFNTVENAVYLRTANLPSTKTDEGDIYSGNQQLQTAGTHINMISRNTYTINVGEYYLLFFNFPLRNNGKVTSGCTYPGSTTYGDAYYHENIWAIVCAVTSNSIGVPGGGSTTRNLRISGFYTPWYYLSNS